MSFQLSPVDIVFCCTVCQETLSTIYADDEQPNGLRKGNEDPHKSTVTKLWLTECAHLTCGKHLPGGDGPNSPDLQAHRSTLFTRFLERHVPTARLRSTTTRIRRYSLSTGPREVNMMKTSQNYISKRPLSSSVVETLGSKHYEWADQSGVDFQYLSLLRSGAKSHEKLKESAKALKRWEDKKLEIVHSLSSVAPLRDELLSARRRLLALGEDVSSIDTTLKLAGVSLIESLHPEQKLDSKCLGQNPAALDGSMRLAQGSAADLEYMNQSALSFNGDGGMTEYESMGQDISSKRKRVDTRSDSEHQNEYVPTGEIQKGQSRDQMPPPPIPMQHPIVPLARVPFSDKHGLNPQHDHEQESYLPRATASPKQQPSQDLLSHSMLAHGSSRRPSSMSLAGNKTNIGQPHIAHRHFSRTNTGTAGPVYTRGGWQPQLGSFDGERLGLFGSPSSSQPSTGQAPVRRPPDYQQGNLIFPIEHAKRVINPSSCSTGSSLYRRRQAVPAMHFQDASPASSRNPNPSPNGECRITLPRTPSFASRHSSDKGIGLSSHTVRCNLASLPMTGTLFWYGVLVKAKTGTELLLRNGKLQIPAAVLSADDHRDSSPEEKMSDHAINFLVVPWKRSEFPH
ncbi:hypothetical protein BDR22DRAFT_824324 [Usnea florida]